MPAYIVFTREKTRDQAELDTYTKEVPAAMPGHKLTPLAVYGKFESLEGAPIEGAVILEFPTIAEAKAWYDSPAYQHAMRHRHLGADYRAFIVEGM